MPIKKATNSRFSAIICNDAIFGGFFHNNAQHLLICNTHLTRRCITQIAKLLPQPHFLPQEVMQPDIHLQPGIHRLVSMANSNP